LTTAQISAPLADRPPTASQHLKHIRELDGIRGLAALMVFFHHALYANLESKDWHGPIRSVMDICAYGNTGVDLFFVLSGFLITSILLKDRTSPRYYQDFYWKRSLRILPLYTVCILAAFATTHDLKAFLFRAFFLANIGPIFHVASSGPFWTLAIEEQFYLIWPTVVRRRSPVKVFYWAIALGLSSFFLRLAFAHAGHHNYSISFLRFDGLAFGAVLACHFRKPAAKANARKNNQILGGLLLLGIATLGASSLITRLYAQTVYYSDALFQTGVVLVTGSIIGLVILHSGARALAILRSRLLTFFGLISFALYMIHDNLLYVYDHFFGPIDTDQVHRLLLRMAVVFAATIALSIASRYCIELPAMSLRKRVLLHPSLTAETENPPLPLANM